jgi:hypothetical protein
LLYEEGCIIGETKKMTELFKQKIRSFGLFFGDFASLNYLQQN